MATGSIPSRNMRVINAATSLQRASVIAYSGITGADNVTIQDAAVEVLDSLVDLGIALGVSSDGDTDDLALALIAALQARCASGTQLADALATIDYEPSA